MHKTIAFAAFVLGFWPQNTMAQSKDSNMLLERDFWKSRPSLSEVQASVNSGNDPTALNRYQFDALSWALIESAPKDVLLYLLEFEGNPINKLTHDARTYVFWAAYRDNLDFVKELTGMGADLSIVDEHGYSLLNFSAVTGQKNIDLYEYLVEHGANPMLEVNQEGAHALLLLAPFIDDHDLIEYFSAFGLTLNDTDSNGSNGFLYACKGGNVTFLKSLVSMGMSPSLQNDGGQNAAHFAAKGTRGRTNGKEVFTFLSSHGVALDDPDQNGITPLMIYVQGESESGGLLFLAQDTKNLHQQDHRDLSAMHHAIASGNPKNVSGLIASGWSMNGAPYKSETLICALSESFNGSNYEVFEEMIQILRPLGIHPVQLLPGGESWFHVGARNQSLDMLQFAAVHQLDVNQVNHEGMSPLLEACLTAKNIDLLKWLVDIGADVGLMSPCGETAFDLASENEAVITADLDFLKAK